MSVGYLKAWGEAMIMRFCCFVTTRIGQALILGPVSPLVFLLFICSDEFPMDDEGKMIIAELQQAMSKMTADEAKKAGKKRGREDDMDVDGDEDSEEDEEDEKQERRAVPPTYVARRNKKAKHDNTNSQFGEKFKVRVLVVLLMP